MLLYLSFDNYALDLPEVRTDGLVRYAFVERNRYYLHLY